MISSRGMEWRQSRERVKGKEAMLGNGGRYGRLGITEKNWLEVW